MNICLVKMQLWFSAQEVWLFSSSLLPFSGCVVSENVKYIFSISTYPLPEKIVHRENSEMVSKLSRCTRRGIMVLPADFVVELSQQSEHEISHQARS